MREELVKYTEKQKARLKELEGKENISSHEMVLELEIRLNIMNLEFILKFY